MRFRLSFAALGPLLIAGCGGGSSGATTDPGGSVPTGPTNSFGSIQTRGQVNGTPIVRDLGQISTVALAGVLTDATYRPQDKPDNETAIAVGTASAIEMVSESGDSIATWQPPLAHPSDYYRYPAWSADGLKLYYLTQSGIYSTTPANPAASTLVINVPNIDFFTLSPDGTQIAYTRIPTGEADDEIFVRGVAGGATKRLTTNDDIDLATCWIDNDRLAIYSNPPGNEGTHVVQVSNLASISYVPFALNATPFARSQNGIYFLNAYASDANHGLSVSQRVNDTMFLSRDYLDPDFFSNYGGSISPDNTRWVCAGSTAGLFTTELLPKTATVVLPPGPVIFQGVAWQPALGITKFVGAAGKLGSTSAGIIATTRTGANRNGLASFVSWDAQTRTTSTVNDDTSEVGSGAKTYTLEADRLTALKYGNRPFFQTVSTVAADGTANGAIVTINGASGVVKSIIVLQETRGAKPNIRQEGDRKIVEGRLLGVWNEKGQNLAPNGASRVVLPASGEPQL